MDRSHGRSLRSNSYLRSDRGSTLDDNTAKSQGRSVPRDTVSTMALSDDRATVLLEKLVGTVDELKQSIADFSTSRRTRNYVVSLTRPIRE